MPTTTLRTLIDSQVVARIWQKDTHAFAGADAGPDVHKAIANRLGWLTAPSGMQAELLGLRTFTAETLREGLTDVYLLGMGGSSLCAEVLRDVTAPANPPIRLVVLDTTDERAVSEATAGLRPEKSLFLVASKSGSTIEVTSLERHFWAVMSGKGLKSVGRHFAAITDPGTSLVDHAKTRGYRHTFVNPADIGGRYSALSLFGLVPAALLGIDLEDLLASARVMAELCRRDDASNPGLSLGAYMAAHSRAGRDKLTLLVSESLAPFGVWVEQLVAESTGKSGRGVLPVVGEPIGLPDNYGTDRAFVAIVTEEEQPIVQLGRGLEHEGHPVFQIETSPADLGAEFFRWEFATAVAGAGLGVNPFDEPNVREAKARTQAQLDTRKATGAFTVAPPLEAHGRYSRREHEVAAAAAGHQRYLAILDYLPADPTRRAAFDKLRAAVRKRTHTASTHGIGPRYLHSTGQYHKGGPNSGRFLLITSDDATSTRVPGADCTFSVLKQAQALGDFDALVAAGRRVVHIHLSDLSGATFDDVERLAIELASN